MFYVQDELAEVLVVLFDSKHRLAPFLTTILNTEVQELSLMPIVHCSMQYSVYTLYKYTYTCMHVHSIIQWQHSK